MEESITANELDFAAAVKQAFSLEKQEKGYN